MFRKLSALIASTSLSDCISFSCCSYTPNSLLAATSYHPSPTVCALLPSHPSSGQVFSRRGQNQLVKFNTRLFQTRDISSTPEKATLESIAESLKSGHYKRILVVAGAGISCSAGIPDFRTPGSGL